MFLNRKAQSVLEYSVLIAIVIAALLAIQIYVKRGVQGRMRSASDDIGEQFDARKTSYTYTTSRTSTTKEEIDAGISNTFMGKDGKGAAEVVFRNGTENVATW
jgi:hypothetical protein